MQTSGVVLDVYDDVGGEVLRSMFATREQIPGFIKQAHALTPVERQSLPDDAFALVLVNGEEKLRKYACIDEGNTTLSILYFLKNAHKLPDEARVRTAENLKVACRWYDLDVPDELEKEAGVVGSALQAAKNLKGAAGTVVGGGGGVLKALGSAAAAPVHAAGAVLNPLKHVASDPLGTVMTAATLPSLVKGTGEKIQQNLANVNAGERMLGPGGGLAAMAGHKIAEVTGTSTMPISADSKKTPVVSDAVVAKTANMGRRVDGHRGENGVEPDANLASVKGKSPTAAPQHMHPVVDVTGKSPKKESTEKKASRFALGEKYPLDSFDQVKMAAAYFDEYGRRFAPAERHEYCTNLVKRASELDVPVSDIVRKYGSEKYASLAERQSAIDTRLSLLEHDQAGHRELLGKIAEAQSTMPPEDYVTLLTEFDKVAGLAGYYDTGHVMDPYYSTYGFTKTAEEEFSDTVGNYFVTGADLKKLTSNLMGVKHTFGHDFADEFRKDPIGIYKSLPVEQKKLLIRMATENSPI